MVIKRDLLLIAFGRLLTSVVALISIRAVTTYLTPSQFGELALLLMVQMFCGLFLINPIGQHINLHTHSWWDDGTLQARLSLYNRYIFAVALAGGVIVMCMNKHGSVAQVLLASLTMFAMLIAATWNATFIPILNMLGFRSASVYWGVVSVVVAIASSILLVRWIPSATAWFAGQFLGMTLGAIGASYTFQRHASGKPQIIEYKHVLIDRNTAMTYCLPLAVATGLMWIQLSGYRIAIEFYWGLASLGYLVVGLQVAGQIFGLIESFTSQILYPMFYRRVSVHGNNAEVERAFSDLLSILLPVYLVVAGVLISSAKYLLKVLVDTQFQDAVSFVMLGAGIELCRVLGNLFSIAAHVRRQAKALTLPYAIGSITTLVAIIIVAMYGMEIVWAGGGILLGGVMMLSAMAIIMHRKINFSIDVARISIGLLVMILIPALSNWLPKVNSIGESVAVLFIIGSVGVGASWALLWKSPASVRMLAIKLRE